MLPYINFLGRDIPTYGICMAVGLLVSGFAACFRAKRFKADINMLIVVMASAVGFGLLGAKLLYIPATYGLRNALDEMSRGDFSSLTGGGLVFYGGLIFGTIGGIVAARLSGENIERTAAILIPCVPLGHVFGRIGCYLAGCCYGRPYSGTFGLKTVQDSVICTLFPIQLLESMLNIIIFLILILFLRKFSGYAILSSYLFMYSIVRFTLEFFRGDELRGSVLFLSTSQWISLALLAVSTISLVVLAVKRKIMVAYRPRR